jgi:tRNA splicing endonuclease
MAQEHGVCVRVLARGVRVYATCRQPLVFALEDFEDEAVEVVRVEWLQLLRCQYLYFFTTFF